MAHPALMAPPMAATGLLLVLALARKAMAVSALRNLGVLAMGFLFALSLGNGIYCWGMIGRFLVMIPAFGYVVLFRRSAARQSWKAVIAELAALAIGIALAMHPVPKCIGDPYWFFCIPPLFINLTTVLAAAALGMIAIWVLEIVRPSAR